MKAGEADDWNCEQDDQSHQDERHDALGFVQTFLVAEHIEHTPGEHGYHVNTKKYEKEEKVSVVPPTDAVVHPGTVMIERFC